MANSAEGEALMIIVSGSGELFSLESIDDEIEKLHSLRTDIQRIKEGYGPTSEQLANAPTLDHWQLTSRARPCLNGEVSGHPVLGSPIRRIITSEVWAFAPSENWCRTYSRWYRLELPASAR